MKQKSLVALGALSAALAACGSRLENKGVTGNTGGTSNATTGGATATGGDSTLLPDGPCVAGIPVTSQIPRLLNRQYENVVRDLLGVTAVDDKPVSEALVGD